jgi:hypothetical protein
METKMSRTFCAILLVTFAWCGFLSAAPGEQTGLPNLRKPVEIGRVKVQSQLDARIYLGLGHLLKDRDRILGGEGHSQGWGPDQVGRWLYAVTQVTAYSRLVAGDERS